MAEFFIADIRDGLGPYLGVFLKENNFLEGDIGVISTIAQLSALIFGVPLGILVDKTKYKRELIALCVAVICVCTGILWFYPHFVLL